MPKTGHVFCKKTYSHKICNQALKQKLDHLVLIFERITVATTHCHVQPCSPSLNKLVFSSFIQSRTNSVKIYILSIICNLKMKKLSRKWDCGFSVPPEGRIISGSSTSQISALSTNSLFKTLILSPFKKYMFKDNLAY